MAKRAEQELEQRGYELQRGKWRAHVQRKGAARGAIHNLVYAAQSRVSRAHLINKDLYIARRVQEIGTASLRNYLLLASVWFKLDLSQYNFFLMPISFFHGFEAAEPASCAMAVLVKRAIERIGITRFMIWSILRSGGSPRRRVVVLSSRYACALSDFFRFDSFLRVLSASARRWLWAAGQNAGSGRTCFRDSTIRKRQE